MSLMHLDISASLLAGISKGNNVMLNKGAQIEGRVGVLSMPVVAYFLY
jgi:hypothetical protein